VRVTFPF